VGRPCRHGSQENQALSGVLKLLPSSLTLRISYRPSSSSGFMLSTLYMDHGSPSVNAASLLHTSVNAASLLHSHVWCLATLRLLTLHSSVSFLQSSIFIRFSSSILPERQDLLLRRMCPLQHFTVSKVPSCGVVSSVKIFNFF
jgi:hypothetical protein